MILEAFNGALKTMDTVPDTHRHKISDSNYIVYKSPDPNQVKYTPPSPTTSGYSESGSEMDQHDSGRASEMEGSPKMPPKRPETISLPQGIFNQASSTPDPFPEGKTTIKTNLNRTPSSTSEQNTGTVTVSERDFKTLVLCLRDASSRLDRMEYTVGELVRALRLQHSESNNAVSKLSRTLLLLGNDFKTYKSSLNRSGRNFQPPKFHDPYYESARDFPLSCNNNNVSSSVVSVPGRGPSSHQSSQCLSPRSPRSLPKKLSEEDCDYQTATFPRFLRSDAPSSPLSVAPSTVVKTVICDNDASTQTDEAERPKSEYMNRDVMATSSNKLLDPANASMTYPRLPVYAVIKKKKRKSVESVPDNFDEPPALPRRSQELLASIDEDLGINGPRVEDLDELINQSSRVNEEGTFSPAVSTLTRISRFSEVESLMSAFENSVLSDEKRDDILDEDFPTQIEVYDNESLDEGLLNLKNEPEEDIFTLGPPRKVDSSGGMTTAPVWFIEKSQNWTSSNHAQNVVYSSTPTLQQIESLSKSSLEESSTSLSASNSKSVSSVTSGKSSKKGSKKKGSSNVLVANYNKIFKKKGKKKRRTESETSFTFVTSPLYEAELATQPKESKAISRGRSVDSIISSQRPTVSSLSNISSSHEGSLSITASREDFSNTFVERNNNNIKLGANRSLLDSQSAANTQLLRLQSADHLSDHTPEDFDKITDFEKYDNLDEGNEEEMRPNLVKLAKKAFRNSPKLLRRSKTDPVIQTAELKSKLPNGHAFPEEITTKKEEPELPEMNLKSPETRKPNSHKEPSIHTDDEIFEDDVFIPPRVILDKLQREQADRIRFEGGHQAGLDEPPPKPKRPEYPADSTRPGYNNQHANGGPGYPRGMPAVPPKQKIMTPEELTIHEAQEKLKMKQMEEAMLQQTLNQQQKQAEENARWLEQEEQMLFTSLQSPDANPEDSPLRRGRGSNNSLTDSKGNMMAPPPPSVPPSKPKRKMSRPKDEQAAGPPQTKLEEVKTAPTMQLNRDDDAVYKNTMEVVKAVLGMNNMTMNAKPDELFASVKTVGAALKQLCASLDEVLPGLPEDFHREIDMAQRTTNKDLSQVINQLKLVQRFYTTTQVVDYKKCLMAANQVLAIDAKNLLDVVDRARIRKIQEAQEQAKAQVNDIRHGAVPQASASGYEPEELYPDGDFL